MLFKNTVTTECLALIKELQHLGPLRSFALVGGTALSLQLGHRRSIDIDLFTCQRFDIPETKILTQDSSHHAQDDSGISKFCARGYAEFLLNSLIIINDMITATQTFKLYEVLNKHFKDPDDAKAIVQEIERVIDTRFASEKDRLATKEDLARTENRIILWIVSFNTILAGIIITLFKLL